MSLADCEKCWDLLCTCGWVYRKWSPEGLEELIVVLQDVLEIRKTKPDISDDDFQAEQRRLAQERQRKAETAGQVQVHGYNPRDPDGVMDEICGAP